MFAFLTQNVRFCIDQVVNVPREFKKLAAKTSLADTTGSVPVHRFCAWMARRHDRYDGDWAAERYIHTEKKMVKTAEHYYTPDENVLGTCPGTH